MTHKVRIYKRDVVIRGTRRREPRWIAAYATDWHPKLDRPGFEMRERTIRDRSLGKLLARVPAFVEREKAASLTRWRNLPIRVYEGGGCVEYRGAKRKRGTVLRPIPGAASGMKFKTGGASQ